MRLTTFLAAAPALLPILFANSFELRGEVGEPLVLVESGITRSLEGGLACPAGFSVQKAFYSVLFDVYAAEEVSCSENDLDLVGLILQEEFDAILMKGNDLLNADIDLLSSETEVCTKYEEAIANMEEGGGDHHHDLRRKLQIGYRIYLYRAAGTCYYCSPDDQDYRKLGGGGSNESSPIQDALNLELNRVFGDILGTVQDRLNTKLTQAIIDSIPFDHCLKDIPVEVESTVALRCEEIQEACEEVYCCADRREPDHCFSDYSFLSACHSTKERCEVDCKGLWIDPFDPPQCLGWLHSCEIDRYGGDECCDGTICHDFGDRDGKGCVLLSDLDQDENGEYCIDEWGWCDDDTDDDPCCDGYYCAKGLVGRQCRKGSKDCQNKWESCSRDDDCCDDRDCRKSYFSSDRYCR